jgi:hypothetical protein
MSLLIALSPEFCAAFGITAPVSVGHAIMVFMIVFALSDILCGLLSKLMKKRKTPLLIYAGLQVLASIYFLLIPPNSVEEYYTRCGLLGFSCGYWGVLITNAAEQFGTNIRATAATATPNLIRGITIPAAITFSILNQNLGIIASGTIIIFSLLLISFISILSLRDKYENDLNFNEGLENLKMA